MFLSAVSRPKYDAAGQLLFDGKIGIFPFIKRVLAKRNSKNRAAGTLETKAMESITKDVTKHCLITQPQQLTEDGPEKEEVYKHLPPPASAESEFSLPWNLRMRRADLMTPASWLFTSSNADAAADAGCEGGSAGGKSPMVNEPKSISGLYQLKAVEDKPMRLRSGGCATASGGKKERPKFSVALSKSEIEEDLYSMVGHRPPRRPKKRNRNVQRQLDTLFPGLWLSEVTPDMYKVHEGEGR